MAGDWIKMRADLREDPAVFAIAERLGVDELHVVGCLHAFWSWCDKHAVDGRVDRATPRLVDKASGRKGFADALVAVRWLEVDDEGIGIPNFDRHNGESAKERSLKNRRQAKWRDGKAPKETSTAASTETSTAPSTGPSTSPSTEASTAASTREEKRREELKALPPSSSTVPATPGREPDPPPPTTTPKSVTERALDLVLLLKPRGCRIPAGNPYVLEWARRGVTDAQLLTAFDRAETARHDKGDPQPVNAGYLNAIVEQLAGATPTIDYAALARL